MASILLYLALASLTAVLYYLNKFNNRFKYFKNKGIQQLKTEFFYGNGRGVIQKKTTQGEFYRDVYNKFKKLGVKHGGIYLSIRRIWVPIDPELIKIVLIKDFNNFSAHFLKLPKRLFFDNLFLMDGDEWRDMRRKLTPTFTSGKMKMMFNIILEKSNGLSDLVGEMCKGGEPAEIKKILARFTTDVIGSCGFGIECNSMENINSEFFIQGQNIFRDSKGPTMLHIILVSLGLRKFRPLGNFTMIENFFRNVVSETITYREEHKVVRKDFLHLMIQLKNKGAVTELTNDNEDIFKKTVDKEVMSIDEIAGECLLFFNAGFETSSTTISFALLELTQNQDVQKKLREEVREVLKRHNGQLSYEALQEMTYCDNVIRETLRKHPAVAILPRVCTKDYTIPGTDSVIEKGTFVNIPIWGLHMDPDHFPEPEKFIPDRFNDQNKSKIKDMTYLPFGEGPRMCLGLRFGIMQSKAGLATLINSYSFTLNERTPYPPNYKKTFRLITIVEGGIWLNATKLN